MFAPDEEDQKPAQDIMTDGIMQIAGGIENVVQQLQLQVTSVFQDIPACSYIAVHNCRNHTLSPSMDWKAVFSVVFTQKVSLPPFKQKYACTTTLGLSYMLLFSP